MKPVWLIEAGVYGEEANPLLAEIRRQGMLAEFVPHMSLQKGQSLAIGGKTLPEDACVIGYGTFPFCPDRRIRRDWDHHRQPRRPGSRWRPRVVARCLPEQLGELRDCRGCR
jgi:hypothetical protein